MHVVFLTHLPQGGANRQPVTVDNIYGEAGAANVDRPCYNMKTNILEEPLQTLGCHQRMLKGKDAQEESILHSPKMSEPNIAEGRHEVL